MSALALAIFPAGSHPDRVDAAGFFDLVARFKCWPGDVWDLAASTCAVRKLNSASSFHRIAAADPASGSWMVAAGTVIDTASPSADGSLRALLRDFLAFGSTVFSRCEGQFAIVVHDGRTGSVSVVTDPLGYFAIYQGEESRAGGATFISTSALAVARHIRARGRAAGIHCFLHTGRVFGDVTLWDGVERLPPATVRTFGHSQMRAETYWRPSLVTAPPASLPEAIDASGDLITSVLRRGLAREGPVWSDLTGGFDTRLMAMMLERAGVPFRANVVGPPDHPDVRIALRIARAMDWPCQHFQLPDAWVTMSIDGLDRALGHSDAHLNVLATLRPLWVHAQEGLRFPVLLSGMGGELWRGPAWWPEQARLGRTNKVHYERQLWSVMHPIDETIFVRSSRDAVREDLIQRFRSVGEQDPDLLNTAKLDRLWLYREAAHAGAWLSLGAGLVRIMTPLFTPSIVQHVLSLDHRLRAGNQVVRHMFERYAPALARIEVEGRGPAGPIRLTNIHRFLPSRIVHLQRAADKASQVLLRRRLFDTGRPTGFDETVWRRAIIDALRADGRLDHRSMRSGALYLGGPFETFLDRARTSAFRDVDLLGRVLTVELAARAVDADLGE